MVKQKKEEMLKKTESEVETEFTVVQTEKMEMEKVQKKMDEKEILEKAEMEMKKEDEKVEWKVEDELNDAAEPEDDSDGIQGSVKRNSSSQSPAADTTAY